ncbi:MAG TPA: chromosomal replication initiator protein DnaA [Candidatus Onthovivens sp.]|nr:chromosomal replication initiator protein DnaA [Candidatus Onthovivens sp.]
MDARTLTDTTKIWNQVLLKLKDKINDTAFYNSMIASTFIHSITGDKMIIGCDTAFAALNISDNFYDLFSATVQEYTGTDYKLTFVHKTSLEEKEVGDVLAANNPRFFANNVLNPTFTFDTFVNGPSNQEAYQAAITIACNPGTSYNPLFIYSPSGLGKTHLLTSIGNHIRAKSPQIKVLYTSSQDFVNEFIAFCKTDTSTGALLQYIMKFDVLLVDDIQLMKDKKRSLEFFFNVFQYFTQNNKQIVLTSDRTPADLDGIDERLVTRFTNGLSVSISPPDIGICVEILKKKLVNEGHSVDFIDEDAIYFIAENCKSSIRGLQGALTRIYFYSSLYLYKKITLDIAMNALDISGPKGGGKQVLTHHKIINTVSSYYGISTTQLTGKIKTANIALARHIAIYLIRTKLDMSYKKIGDTFSNRDHSTIMHSVQYVEKQLKKDSQMCTVIEELNKRIA